MTATKSPDSPAERGTRKGMIAAGACVIVAAAGYLAITAVGGGSSASPAAAGAVSTPSVASGAASPTTTTTVPSGQATPLYNIYTAKDPFQPTLTAAKSPAAAESTTTTVPAGATSASSGGSGSAGTTTTTPPSSGGGAAGAGATSGSSAPSRGNQISVMSVYAYQGQTTASISVDDTVYRVVEGDHFGGNYSVVSLSQATQCASLNNGRVTFQVCQGQQILK